MTILSTLLNAIAPIGYQDADGFHYGTPVLDLTEFLLVPGERVHCRRVMAQRARDAHSRKRHRQFLNDPLVNARDA